MYVCVCACACTCTCVCGYVVGRGAEGDGETKLKRIWRYTQNIKRAPSSLNHKLPRYVRQRSIDTSYLRKANVAHGRYPEVDVVRVPVVDA